MKIIDAHIHFRPDFDAFSQIAKGVGHENTEKYVKEIFEKLENDEKINVINYKGIKTYRLK